MEVRYLRVKKWREYQHYTDRRPPWIKLLRKLIESERDFNEKLTEQEQWQLVRLWLYASGSETVMYDDQAREVPLVAYDEQTLRLGIRTAKKIPLAKFIHQGWLEVVTAAEVAESLERVSDPNVASAIASGLASTGASTGPPKSGVTTPTEKTEAAELSEKTGTAFIGDPVEVLIANVTQADVRTPAVIRAFESKLPPAAFAQALAQLRANPSRSRAKYVVGTLKKMVEEGQYAA
jgi:hypothetical protein